MYEEIPMILEREAGMPENCPQVGVGFCMHAIEDAAKSAEAGRPIFRDVEFVRIQVPGDKNSVVFQPATDVHRKKYPRAFAVYKQQIAVATEGTPIEVWPAITRGLALTLKAAGIPTVEALAEVHDGNLDKLGHGIRELRTQARGFIAQAEKGAAAQELARRLQERDDMIAELSRQVQDLAKRLGEPAPAPPKAKPRKAAAAKPARKKAA